ncbi:MAG: hypothetical protein OXC48_00835, partial [Endozoicomonadaceae bacterium]|nr:hypothetical protein [Endozoicomonadaceae bacterium]
MPSDITGKAVTNFQTNQSASETTPLLVKNIRLSTEDVRASRNVLDSLRIFKNTTPNMLKAQTKTTCDRKEGIVNSAFCADHAANLKEAATVKESTLQTGEKTNGQSECCTAPLIEQDRALFEAVKSWKLLSLEQLKKIEKMDMLTEVLCIDHTMEILDGSGEHLSAERMKDMDSLLKIIKTVLSPECTELFKNTEETQDVITVLKRDLNQIKKHLKDYTDHIKVLISENDDIYFGQLNENEKEDGFGIRFLKNGDIEMGMFSNGERHGWNRCIETEGCIFEGFFHDGLEHGLVKLTFKNGCHSFANFRNGEKEGSGISTYNKASKPKPGKVHVVRYEGSYSEGRKDGEGKITCSNGNTMEMTFSHGKHSGKARITYTDGSIYQGDIQNGLSHGKGILLDKEGHEIFEGEFYKGLPNCTGRPKNQ